MLKVWRNSSSFGFWTWFIFYFRERTHLFLGRALSALTLSLFIDFRILHFYAPFSQPTTMYSFGNIIFFAITLVSPISLDAGNVCTDGTRFTQCGAPPLTAEQIANIDTDRVNQLRNTMMNLPGGRGPLVENHPGIPTNLLQPIVNFTDEQLAVYESKYPPYVL